VFIKLGEFFSTKGHHLIVIHLLIFIDVYFPVGFACRWHLIIGILSGQFLRVVLVIVVQKAIP
jgi:hypothetical protein